jgi:phosphoserine phosphatase
MTLPSWRDTPTREAIVRFVEGLDAPAEERVAVFDNDGTLWCEKPMPVELGFVLERLAAMAEADASLRGRQPWKAAHERDHEWLGGVMIRHYRGDDSDVKILIAGILQAFAGWDVERYGASAAEFLGDRRHPTLELRYADCAYRPMVELLRYLEAHGFTVYVASGGDRDFMRQVTWDAYGIPPERVIGSTNALAYRDGAVVYEARPDVFDDGPAKPVRIWSRIGRRPILAAGNSNGDIPMLEFAGGGRPALRLLVDHDDDAREFGYRAGAEGALERAAAEGWTVVSMKRDWATVFDEP